jgi:Fis family transcriptional regulator
MRTEQARSKQIASTFIVPKEKSDEPLRECVREAVDDYFSHLNGHSPARLYELVIHEVEQPLLESVMRHAGSNQTRAAEILGISRSTLRKKLARYGIT